MSIDFTLKIYRRLLESLQQAGYSFFTFEDYCQGNAQGQFVILRHDVDLRAAHSLATAKIETDLGIRASYYFRIVPQSNQPNIIKAITALGHEIGYHYEEYSLFKGDVVKCLAHFNQQLEYFRGFYPVKTISMHGSPTSKYDNRDIWKTYNYKDFGIIGEPYFDIDFSSVYYITDTGRMWDGNKYNVRDKVNSAVTSSRDQQNPGDVVSYANVHFPIHSTTEFMHWLQSSPQMPMMITTHPQRWTDSKIEWLQELIMQRLKNVLKRCIVKSPQ